jgi:hypothetical protein
MAVGITTDLSPELAARALLAARREIDRLRADNKRLEDLLDQVTAEARLDEAIEEMNRRT